MKSEKKGFAHFCAAFRYSMSGQRVAVRETAVQHELLLGVVHFVLLYVCHIAWLPAIVLSAIWVGVLVVELLNTAIEAVVDLVSPDYHELAGRAKDLGSAAVFLALLAFGCSWAIVLWRMYAV